MIAIGIILVIIGLPGRASAHSKPHVSMRKISALAEAAAAADGRIPAPPMLTVASPPSPHPSPAGRSPMTRPSMSHPVAPAPVPQTPPSQRALNEDIAAPYVIVLPDTGLQVRPVAKHAAVRTIAPDQLARSLIYSSALALLIAASGLILIGSRRRLW
ncbi:MAG TPA: hypothetical protein VGJ28_10155 [Micromonosporaceae bacterium]|jgi:hypothetical protein